ncbi:complement component C8 gamma chain [Trichomycterus rosablanca]|uniref:complement component C8 gamma chain n=1 Tax=Trichomycterus rosablanca TaxID=2290929 RepID=UPI002F34F5B9
MRTGTIRASVCLLVVLTLVLSLCDAGKKKRWKPQPKPKKPDEKPVEEMLPARYIDINQMSGKWYLLTVASRCPYLLEHGYKAEGTIMTLTAPASPGGPVKMNTLTKHNFQCWEIQQDYETTNMTGIFLLKSRIPVKNTDVLVVDTDYSSYTVLLYKRMKNITMKLYGRSTRVSDAVVDKFEDLATKQNLGLDVIFEFPVYGFCPSADKEHTLVMT